MEPTPPEKLKAEVREFWNQQSCDTQVSTAAKFSKDYFEQIESFRYFDQPFIHSFAQFTRYHGKRVLEVGFGAGTDFIQWLRAGALASGIDLTPEALQNLSHRIQVYGLPKPESIQVADAEKLPFADDSYDLGYSFGVLHHSPRTEKAVGELVRVIKPGGELKIMVYNRWSIFVVNQWIKQALLRGRPWKTLRWVLWNHIESVGTKGYTVGELSKFLSALPLESVQIHTEITAADYLSGSAFPPLNWINRLLLRLGGSRYGWRPEQYVGRIGSGATNVTVPPAARPRGQVLVTGNRWGFFHCISARKRG